MCMDIPDDLFLTLTTPNISLREEYQFPEDITPQTTFKLISPCTWLIC